MIKHLLSVLFLAAAVAASGAEGFRFERDGLVTPRGKIAWGDMLEIRSYERPTQKYKTYGATAKVRVFTETRVELDFVEKESGSYVPMRLDLDDTYLRARVDAGDIVEPLGCSYRVMELAILPTVMDAKVGEEGRYLLPIFGGCVAPFKADRRLFTRDRIYVQQDNWEKMGMINAFGASRSGDSTLGVVHEGDFSAWVETTIDPATGLCRQSPVVRVREDPGDVQSFERKEILFRNLKGAKDWTKMALAYGDYLRREREILPIEVREQGNARLKYLLEAVRVNIFMGLKKPFVPDGSSPYFSATTFAEAEKIVDEVHSRGIDKAWFCLVGWIKDGHDGAYPSHFPVNEKAGGEAALRRLIAKIRGYGYAVTPHDNIHSCYASSSDYDSQIPCRTRAGEELPMGVWSGGMIRIGCPHLYVQRYGGDFARIRELGFEGVYYIDALMPVLFQCYDARHPADERQFIEGQLRVLQWMKGEYGVAATETQAVPALKYIDYGSNGSSGDRVYFAKLLSPDTKAMFERYVPFYNVAMHGLLVYQSGWVHAFRKKGKWLSAIVDGGVPAVETAMRNGANGDYYLDSLDDMMEWWKVCFKVAPEFSRGIATDFEEFAPDAVRWTFHNGLEMWVNATDAEAGGMKPRSIRLLRNGREIYANNGQRPLPAATGLAVDFGVEKGKIRPALHSSGFGPTICSQTAQDLADVKAMGFKYARTHDWALINPNQRVCDYFHVFPLMHLDAKDPANYHFGPTDYLLKRTREEAGLEVFYRLGTSIEHSGERVHFNSLVPDDFDKVAEIFAATVRHYNRGWADGFDWGLRYWEIWNEPEGYMSMWAPKEGTEHLSPEEKEKKAEELRERFTKFFVVALKRLKDEFGDTIKVGGPALQIYRENWLRPILAACKAAGVAPDFISWHGYADDPMQYSREAEQARALCDSFGFTNCELHINEWHYFGYADYDWTDMQRCSDPAVKARIWTGPNSHNGIKSACYTLAALANLQRSKIDQAYYYGCRHTGAWGFKDEHQKKFKVFYALKLFGDLVRDYETICESASEGSVTTFAVRNAAGRKGLLVVDYAGSSRTIAIDVKGVTADAKPTCALLDHTHDLTPHDVAFEGGRLTLVKPDANSAAFFIAF